MAKRVSKMPKQIVSELFPEQEILLSKYIEKWKAIATLTQPIDRGKISAAIRVAYKASDLPKPEIIFFATLLQQLKKL
ncbi:hypothetical protein ACP6PL_24200 [Dapis sp. BLCC M126]|uniref:hypothetical protein n=1 Tax=Dapis sp. BLCC M126 TaxID=3400189 RepID=UPI003CEB0D84